MAYEYNADRATKICKMCGIEKTLDMYYKHRSSSQGVLSKCKSCQKAYTKDLYSKFHPKDLGGFKICKICGLKKSIGHFRFNNFSKDKKETRCKKCEINRRIEYRKRNEKKEKEYNKKWSKDNSADINAKRRKRRGLNKEKYNKIVRERRAANKEKYKEAARAYRAANKDSINRNQRRWLKIKREKDVSFRIAKSVSSRIRHALTNSGERKCKSYKKYLGCDVEVYKIYLESQFVNGMSWSNYGKAWHIDHKIPISWFNLSNLACCEKAFNYANTQPLLISENLSKGNRRHDFNYKKAA